MQQKEAICSMNDKNGKMVKDYIMEALLQLMDRKNYNDITITDITKRAGVNRVSFYRNFNDKDEIINEHLKKCDQQFNEKIKDNDNALYQMLMYFSDNKRIINLLYKSKCQYLLVEHILSNWNYSKEDENIIAYTKSAWAYFMLGWANEWYLRGMKETPEELIQIFESIQGKNKG